MVLGFTELHMTPMPPLSFIEAVEVGYSSLSKLFIPPSHTFKLQLYTAPGDISKDIFPT